MKLYEDRINAYRHIVISECCVISIITCSGGRRPPLLCNLVFLYVFPIMGACCAQIKGFTLGCREHGSRKT